MFLLQKFAILLSLPVLAAAATIVSIDPSAANTGVGGSITLDVSVDSVTDLYAWQFDLAFDPTILSAIDLTEGAFLATGGTTFFLAGTIDNVAGTITFNGNTLVGAVPGVTGGGVLAHLQLQGIGAGLSSVTLSNILLYDSSFGSIDATSADGAVTVNQLAVPEPTMALPVLALLFAGALRYRHGVKVAALALGAVISLPAVDITTAQFDSARSMSNPAEIYLTKSNVNVARFGKLFARNVDGAIFAQPVYLQGATIGNAKVNIVYVVTSHNWVYAFNADNPNASTPIWSVNVGNGNYDTPSGWNTGLGILSTPLIVRSTGSLYVTAATRESGFRVYRLHALDLLTGAAKPNSPATIEGSVTGSAGDAVNGVVHFHAGPHVQRTGIALSGNNIILTFAGDRDQPPYHGWIFSYDMQTLQRTGIFSAARNNAAVNGTGSGIWQSGRAPAVDAAGGVYFETGNGSFDGVADFGESFLKLTPSANGFTFNDWFTPESWPALNDLDYDISSTGPTLIPGTNFVFGGSKTGIVYLLATGNLGHLSSGDTNIVQQFLATSGCVIPAVFQGCAQIMGHAFWPTAPVPQLYVWGVHDVPRSYQFVNGRFNPVATSVGTLQATYPGGVMALSSYLGTANTGILWAVTNDTPDQGFYFGPGFLGTATLRALDANNLSVELWNSTQNDQRDRLGTFASFAPPVAVNGKVYVPTFSNQLVVYGLINGPVTGDVNGDNVANCADLSIVRGSFGKSSAQPGFDLRADVNGDGVVNVLDLATVSRQVPAGTVCP